MALTIEFSRRSTNQLQKILTFYDERNGSDTYSRRLLRCLTEGRFFRYNSRTVPLLPQNSPPSVASVEGPRIIPTA